MSLKKYPQKQSVRDQGSNAERGTRTITKMAASFEPPNQQIKVAR